MFRKRGDKITGDARLLPFKEINSKMFFSMVSIHKSHSSFQIVQFTSMNISHHHKNVVPDFFFRWSEILPLIKVNSYGIYFES